MGVISENEIASHLELASISSASLRIIADHARAATFLINDGVLPANEGRGYVLRKILRRGIRHGRLLGQEQPFLFEMVYAVRDLMKGAYPELVDSAARVAKVVEAEEKQFDRVLKTGSVELQKVIDQARYSGLESFVSKWTDRMNQSPALRTALARSSLDRNLNHIKEVIRAELGESEGDEFARQSLLPTVNSVLPGFEAFHLYETFGFPLDFMVDAARDAGVNFDDARLRSRPRRGAGSGAGIVEGQVEDGRARRFAICRKLLSRDIGSLHRPTARCSRL